MKPVQNNNNTIYNNIIRPLARGTRFVVNEVYEAGRNDPALAMRLAATQIAPTLMNGVTNPEIGLAAEKGIVPVVRTGLLALNAARAVKTFKDPSSTLAERGLDGIRVA